MSFEYPTVLVVDDDSGVRAVIREILTNDYICIEAASGAEALRVVRSSPPHVVLLDQSMPGLSGLEVCEKLRTQPETTHIPVIMLTALDEKDIRVEAFALGADDFIGKPFDAQELRARIGSKTRRLGELRPKGILEQLCGNLTLNPEKLEAKLGNQVLLLSQLEFRLLYFFVNRVDTLVTRRQVVDQVWGNSRISDRLIDAHLVSLRKKIQGFDHTLKTVYGVGYILQKRASTPNLT